MFPNEPTVNKLYSKDQPSYHYDDRKKIFKSKLKLDFDLRDFSFMKSFRFEFNRS